MKYETEEAFDKASTGTEQRRTDGSRIYLWKCLGRIRAMSGWSR